MSLEFPKIAPNVRGISWTGLHGSSPALAMAHLATEHPGATVVVTPRESDAERLQTEAPFFLSLLGKPKLPVFHYPQRPSDLDPAHLSEPHIGWQRVRILHHLLESSGPSIVVISFHALAQLTLPKELLIKLTDLLESGAEIDREQLIQKLVDSAYDRETVVEEPGSFAVRGAILDFFPPHTERPIRAELSGDKIESLRTFDPETQRSLESLTEAIILPCREVLMDEERRKIARRKIKEFADSRDIPRNKRMAIDDAVERGSYEPIFENLLPLFFETPGRVFDFVPTGAQWLVCDPFGLKREIGELHERFAQATEIAEEQPFRLKPGALSIPLDEAETQIRDRVRVLLADATLDETSESRTLDISPLDSLRQALLHKNREQPLRPLLDAIGEWRANDVGVLLVVANDMTMEKLRALLAAHIPDLRTEANPFPGLIKASHIAPVITVGNAISGFIWPSNRLAVITEHEIYGERKVHVMRPVSREDGIGSLSEITEGGAVVHLDHGVGLYRGLERLTVAGVTTDFVHLEYGGGDKLYLPVYRLNRIQKYIGSDSHKPTLDRLGARSTWDKTREKARKAVEEMAQELIQLYAARKIAARPLYGKPDEAYMSFEADFPFEETRDQLQAIEQISGDLGQEKPMDRLICGDVGFGKTEVALRAAFRVAMDGKQVAMLVPTTVLAAQHFQTFSTRMKPYPIRVDFLSRFKAPKQQKDVVAKMKDGSIDIVIGTHRLLSKDVAFRDLGLLLIDEEHRFGVKHKERIRQYRNRVDVLTLTATPIPRTLQLSLSGIRDLSVINTPPLDRKAIETYLCRFDDALIRGAILKEVERGGQVFFVHNRVETIAGMAQYLHKLVPKIRVVVAHGQMSEKHLEDAMVRFLHREFDVLLCTTIIESGLDIPSANTILINRADHFGLAQLYQLRGRVGRSERSAYAYLLVPGEELISRDALKRLKVLKRFTELGSGLKIALHDLEIRGAGNLLGPSQSGHVSAVGFELYLQLLEREVRRLKGETVVEEVEPEIQCAFPAFLPTEYVPEPGERLILYKRLSQARTDEELAALRTEFLDRFGALPPVAENLFRIVELKILARRLGISALRMNAERPTMEFTESAALHLDRLLQLAKKDRRISFRPDNRLILELKEGTDSLEETKKVLQALI